MGARSAVDAWRPTERHRQAARDVAKLLGVDEFSIFGRSRKKSVSEARQAAAYVLRRRFGLSLRRTGVVLGGLHHSTIVHAMDEVEARAAKSASFAMKLDSLIEGSVAVRAAASLPISPSAEGALVQGATLGRDRGFLQSEIAALSADRRVKPKNELVDDDCDALERC
ncbi:MAG: helix-turn-helix domain-containing protein, partial [Pseudomonadota bacterium]